MEEQNKIDSLADTLFELMENISSVEDSLEKFKGEVKSEVEGLKSSLDSLKSGESSKKSAQSKKVDSELAKRFKRLESNINSVISSGALEVLSKKIDKKALIKKEIRRYQFMIIFVLLLIAGGSGAFFYLKLSTTLENLIAFGAVMAVFLIALLVINNNLKLAISEEKRTPKRGKIATDDIAVESHTLDVPDIDELQTADFEQPRPHTTQHKQNGEIAIRNTFED